jgi:hypothetical protein
MAEQQTQQSTKPADTTQAPATITTAPAAPATTPLEKVYTDFKIEADAAEFKPQPKQDSPQVQAPVAPKVPDPFDPNFGAYQQQLATGLTALNQALADTQGRLTNMQQQLTYERTEADIKQAVGTIVEKSGLKPSIAEVALQAKARDDPRFRAIWNNRTKNPVALKAALNAVAEEFQAEFTVKQDPQLVENQRAVQASRNAMATTQKQSDQDKWTGMTPNERQAEVQKMIRGGR